jgi:hypothetical protein
MRNVVTELSSHDIFKLCAFENRRFAYEDAVAKLLHLLLTGFITDIKPTSIKTTYERHKDLSLEHPVVKKARKAFNFIFRAFKDKPPKFRKYAMITLPYLTIELLDKYDLKNYPAEFADGYLQFEYERAVNRERPEENQDPRLAAYTDAARADDLRSLRYRHELLQENIVRTMPDLALKDPTRDFTSEQRMAIFWRDGGFAPSPRTGCL